MAFMVAAFAGCAAVAASEDIYYFATDVVFWNTWRLHPSSVFIGTLVFLVTLYLLQRLNNARNALPLRLRPYAAALRTVKRRPGAEAQWILACTGSCR